MRLEEDECCLFSQTQGLTPRLHAGAARELFTVYVRVYKPKYKYISFKEAL